jgi:hypothetical protein
VHPRYTDSLTELFDEFEARHNCHYGGAKKSLQGSRFGRTLCFMACRLNDKQLRGFTSSSMSSRPSPGRREHADIAILRVNQEPGKGYPITSW